MHLENVLEAVAIAVSSFSVIYGILLINVTDAASIVVVDTSETLHCG